jgi:hypothetical protein
VQPFAILQRHNLFKLSQIWGKPVKSTLINTKY